MAKLTPKQQRFVGEYLIDLNATQAAIRAGYSIEAANQIGNEIKISRGYLRPSTKPWLRGRSILALLKNGL